MATCGLRVASGPADNLGVKTDPRPGGSVNGGRPDAAASVGGWAPMARDLSTVAGILDDLPYPAHLQEVDADRTYPWVAVNAAALDTLRLTRDEVIGRSLADVIPDGAAAALMRRRRDEVVARLEPVKGELAVDLATGRRRFDTTLVPIRDREGRCSHIFTVWNDATTLRESEVRLRTAAESGDKGFSIFESVRDDNGHIVDFRFLYANENALENMRKTSTETIGRTLRELVSKVEMERVIPLFANVAETGDVFEAEFTEQILHPGERWLHQQVTRVGDGIAITINDITDRKVAEQEVARRIDVERLVAGVSRELNSTPIDQLDAAITAALAQIATGVEAGAAALVQYTPDGQRSIRTHEWPVEISRMPADLPVYPWLNALLEAPDHSLFRPEDLPEAHAEERRMLEELGVATVALLPVRNQGALTGFVNLTWTNERAVEFESVLPTLVVVGDVIAGALERKVAEDALRRHDERFRALVQHTSDVISILDREGRIVYHSPAAFTMLGWQGDELIGSNASELVHPEDRERVMERFLHGLTDQRNEPVEFRLRGRDGTWHDVESIGNNLLDDPAIRGVVLTTRDITERKRAEAAVRESEQRFRALVQNTSDIITVQRADGSLDYVSPAVTTVLGWPTQQAWEAPYQPFELIHPNDRDRVMAAFTDGLAQPGVGPALEYRMLHADGSWRDVESIGNNLLDDPAVGGVVVTTREITERKQAEFDRARQGEAEHLISEISRGLLTATEHDVDAVLEDALGQLARFLGAGAGALQHFSADGDSTVRSHLWVDKKGEPLRGFPDRRPTRGWFVDALQDAEHLLIASDDFDDWFPGNSEALTAIGLAAIAFLPVRSGGRLSGFVAFSWFDAVPAEAETVLSTLRVLADVFMAALERTRTETSRRESEARYRGVVEASPDLIFRIRRDGTYLDVHGNPDRLLTLPEETIGRTVHEVRPAADAVLLMRNIERALETRTMQTFEHDVEVHGEDRSFDVRIVPVAEDEALYIVRDVTERVEAEQAVRRSEQRFRALVQNSTDMITVLDADGVVTYTSPASGAVLGWSEEERTGGFAWDLVHPDDRDTIVRMFSGALERPGPSEMTQLRLRHQDGSWRTIEAVGTNLLDDPAVRGFVVNGRDVTDRQRLEEQLLQAQKMEAVGQLAGGVAHDFNNLLTAISGYVALLLEDVPAHDPMHDDLSEIERAAQRAAALVDQLLAFSRRKMVQPTVIDLNEVVDSMRSLMRRLLPADVELETALAPTLPGMRADRSQIEQVIMNLVVNARDSMPEGGPLLIESSILDVDEQYAAGRFDVAPGRYVCLTMSDRGMGMDAATLARVFEPFFSTKEVGQGTGLGLSTVYGIVSQAGGHVSVYSEPGEGTTFRVCFPAVAASGELRAPDDEPSLAAARTGTETILVVEDEGSVRSLASEVLRRSGYRVLVAADGAEAVAVADAHDGVVDLLVTDVVLPGIRGVAVAEQLLARRPNLRVLYISGYTESAIVKGGELTEDIEFLAKPFQTGELARRVRKVLDDAPLATT